MKLWLFITIFVIVAAAGVVTTYFVMKDKKAETPGAGTVRDIKSAPKTEEKAGDKK